MVVSSFKLPVEYSNHKQCIDQHTIIDLELVATPSVKSLYDMVFAPNTEFGKQTIHLWSKYFTTDVMLLTDSQKLIKNGNAKICVDNKIQGDILQIKTDILEDKSFLEKYGYIEWKKFQSLNENSTILQCISVYNLASPILALIMPIIVFTIPLIALKCRGVPISLNSYIQLLKTIMKGHQLSKMFDIGKMSTDKIIYACASLFFYLVQIYQNIKSCQMFLCNNKIIHRNIKIIKEYLMQNNLVMESMINKCSNLKSYAKFVDSIKLHKKELELTTNMLSTINDNKIGINSVCQIGYVLKCYYHIFKNNTFHNSLWYSFDLNGFNDNLNGLYSNIRRKILGSCKYKNSIVKFKDAYFPVISGKTVYNSYKLDRHLILTGPNASGKTTLLKATIFNVILSQQIGFGFYKSAIINPYDTINCYINIPDTSARDSLFQSEARRCKTILSKIDEYDKSVMTNPPSKRRHLCVFDELFSGTNPYEAISSAYAFLFYLNTNENVNFVLTTHFINLCAMFTDTPYVHNFHMVTSSTTAGDIEYTYKIENGISNIKGGVKILEKLDFPKEIIEMTNSVLQQIDIFV